MLRRMMAEIIFLNPTDASAAMIALSELGYELEEMVEWIDDESGARWILAFTRSELDPTGFFESMQALVKPMGGDIVEAGYAPADLEAWIRAKS